MSSCCMSVFFITAWFFAGSAATSKSVFCCSTDDNHPFTINDLVLYCQTWRFHVQWWHLCLHRWCFHLQWYLLPPWWGRFWSFDISALCSSDKDFYWHVLNQGWYKTNSWVRSWCVTGLPVFCLQHTLPRHNPLPKLNGEFFQKNVSEISFISAACTSGPDTSFITLIPSVKSFTVKRLDISECTFLFSFLIKKKNACRFRKPLHTLFNLTKFTVLQNSYKWDWFRLMKRWKKSNVLYKNGFRASLVYKGCF